jgi:hypothetical protein
MASMAGLQSVLRALETLWSAFLHSKLGKRRELFYVLSVPITIFLETTMRKMLSIVTVSLALLATQALASDHAENPSQKIWKCQMKFHSEGSGQQFFTIGSYVVEGHGLMSCIQIKLLQPEKNQKRIIAEIKTAEELQNLSDNVFGADTSLLEVHIPLDIHFAGVSPLQVGFGHVEISGYSMQWSLLRSLANVLGRFVVADGFASVGVGAGAYVAAKASKNDFSMQLALEATEGFGFLYGVSYLTLAVAKAP